MISIIEIIKKHFNGILLDEDSIKVVIIDNLGYLCILRTNCGFLIGISYESRDNIFGASIDFDESKFGKCPKYLKIQLDNKEMYSKQRKFIRRKLGLFQFFKKDFVKFVDANIEFYGEYFKNNHQKLYTHYLHANRKLDT